ncbi:heavy metal-associated domain-containing protein [Halobacteriovorax sp. RZ-1]|uniref:heavy-metal-associated domain-containing protein n=1 Tax=unclassified Halobacteriovorax TaxID=2639665 RepID=UPI0037168251
MKKIILLLTFLISVSIQADNTVTKDYYVKGMTCGGCILGVKVALKKAEGVQFLDQNVSVGIARIKFNEKQYNGEETDCNASRAIEKYTEYKVFLDKAHKKLACNQL